MPIVELKWKLIGTSYRNPDSKNLLIQKTIEKTAKILNNDNISVYFEKDQLFCVSFPIENIKSNSINLAYKEIENLLSTYKFLPFIRLNRNVGTTWDLAVGY